MCSASTTAPAPLPQRPVTELKGVGEQLAGKLARLGIHSLQDLLFHLPLRYQDRTRVTAIGALRPNTEAVIEAEVRGADVVFGRRRSLLVKVQDASGLLSLRFFHFSAAQKQQLQPGLKLRCYGEVRFGPSGLEMVHPEYRRADQADPLADALTPIYPATEGVTQPRLRGLLRQLLAQLEQLGVDELLPESLRQQLDQVALSEALRYLHAPPPDAPLDQLAAGEHPYQQRLAFEELLAHHLSLLRLRQQARAEPAPVLRGDGALQERFLAQLPFPLTEAQQRVAAEIAADLARPEPMLRLVQGDVGSGKTVVAALAVLAAVANGKQAAVMAPTEILAEQHRQHFSAWLEPLGIAVGFLTGKHKGRAREQVVTAIASGQAAVVVGTHALFQDSVQFHDLALTVVDEQHRFGVHQRLALGEKGGGAGERAHQLIMTATPIPRTLAMSVYADLDLSVIDQLPPGRTPVNTVVISNDRRDQVVTRVRDACAEGRQAYWVCTLIEESDVLEAQAAAATHAELAAALPDLRVGLVHGRLSAAEKNAAIAAFAAGDTQLLVATTVIEVGVDVPNASLMIIENPERLGLAQLHQLRGRVGRGAVASHCVLLYHPPLSQAGKARLGILRASNDGFRIAEEDLKLRGPGEVLGTRQTGDLQFRLADLARDAHLLPAVKRGAELLLREHPALAQRLIQRWLADAERYARV